MKTINIFHIIYFTSAYIGLANTNIAPRILGGTPVGNNTTYPYYVSIQERNGHICGGTIINENTVLTVAHCVVDRPKPLLSILAGTNQLGSQTGIRYHVKEVIVSPEYQSAFLEHVVGDRPEIGGPPRPGGPFKSDVPNNRHGHHHHHNNGPHPPHSHEIFSFGELHDDDIALLKTEENFEYSKTITNANIVSKEELDHAKHNKQTAVIIGFGETDDAMIPKNLQQQEVNILTNEECEKDIGKSCHENYNKNFQICMKPLVARSKFAGAGPRDDGGPVILNNKLVGIILDGKHEDGLQCHESSIALNVNSYMNFISTIVNM